MYKDDVRVFHSEDTICSQTDPELFFPEKGEGASLARKICVECPMTIQCLLTALDNREEFGIWGGATAKERKSIRTREQAVRFVQDLRWRFRR